MPTQNNLARVQISAGIQIVMTEVRLHLLRVRLSVQFLELLL
jgi:hypothetical protein